MSPESVKSVFGYETRLPSNLKIPNFRFIVFFIRKTLKIQILDSQSQQKTRHGGELHCKTRTQSVMSSRPTSSLLNICSHVGLRRQMRIHRAQKHATVFST